MRDNFQSTISHLQGDSGGLRLGWVDLDLGSSPGWWAVTVAPYCPSGWWNIPNLSQPNPVADLTPPPCILIMLACMCRWPAAPLSGSLRWARRGCPRGRGRRSSGRTGRRTTRAGTCRSHADLCMLLSEANEDIHSADMRKLTQARLQ